VKAHHLSTTIVPEVPNNAKARVILFLPEDILSSAGCSDTQITSVRTRVVGEALGDGRRLIHTVLHKRRQFSGISSARLNRLKSGRGRFVLGFVFASPDARVP